MVENKTAVSSGAYYRGDDRGPGRFVFYASPRGDVTMDALEMAVAAEITDIIKNGITAEEVIRAKERMVAEAVYARDSLKRWRLRPRGGAGIRTQYRRRRKLARQHRRGDGRNKSTKRPRPCSTITDP